MLGNPQRNCGLICDDRSAPLRKLIDQRHFPDMGACGSDCHRASVNVDRYLTRDQEKKVIFLIALAS
jgi:hypothetical protein